MMGYQFGTGYGMFGSGGFFMSLIGLLTVVFLILGIAYFWQELTKKKK